MSPELQFYAAADANCHQVVAIELQKALGTKHIESSTGPCTFDNHSIVHLNFQGKVVA
jgi:hypothetical protein